MRRLTLTEAITPTSPELLGFTADEASLGAHALIGHRNYQPQRDPTAPRQDAYKTFVTPHEDVVAEFREGVADRLAFEIVVFKLADMDPKTRHVELIPAEIGRLGSALRWLGGRAHNLARESLLEQTLSDEMAITAHERITKDTRQAEALFMELEPIAHEKHGVVWQRWDGPKPLL